MGDFVPLSCWGCRLFEKALQKLKDPPSSKSGGGVKSSTSLPPQPSEVGAIIIVATAVVALEGWWRGWWESRWTISWEGTLSFEDVLPPTVEEVNRPNQRLDRPSDLQSGIHMKVMTTYKSIGITYNAMQLILPCWSCSVGWAFSFAEWARPQRWMCVWPYW
jgi:hypothetical protein